MDEIIFIAIYFYANKIAVFAFGKSRWFLSCSFQSASFSWANSLCFWFCGVLWYLTTRTTATATQLRQLSSTTTNYSVRPPAHNPYYVTSHTAAVQAAVAAAMPPGPAASTAGPFVDIVGHQAHQQAQSAIAVPVMPPGAGRSLHYHTHAATHALPHQQSPLTYPNWVPFSHFN